MTTPIKSESLSRLPEAVKVNQGFIYIVPEADAPFYEQLGLKYRGPRRDQRVYEPGFKGHEHLMTQVRQNKPVKAPCIARHPITFGQWQTSIFGPPEFAKAVRSRLGVAQGPLPMSPALFSEWQYLCHLGQGELSVAHPGMTVTAAVQQEPPRLPFLSYDARRQLFVYVTSLTDRRDLTAEGFAKAENGTWYTTSLAAAMEKAGEADCVLRGQLDRFKTLWPFTVKGLTLADFNLTTGQQDGAGGKGKAKKKASAEEQRTISYDCSSDTFFTSDFATAVALGLPPDSEAVRRFLIKDMSVVLDRRKLLDNDAEIGLICRLLEQLDPNDIEPWLLPPDLVEGEKYDEAQITGIVHAITRPVASLADDMGFGKTYMGVGVCDMRRDLHPTKNPMIMAIVPASQRSNWTRTLARITKVPFNIVRYDGADPEFAENRHVRFLKKSEPVPTANANGTVVIVGYEEAIGTPQLFDVAWNQVIYDESHMAKNPHSLRGAALMPKGALDPDRGVVTENFLGMTGTETPLGAIDLYPIIIHALWRLPAVRSGAIALPSYSRFKEIFAAPTGQDEARAQAKRDARKHRMDRLARALDEGIRLRRLKSDTPGKIRDTISVHCSDQTVVAMAAREGQLTRILDGKADRELRSATMSELSQLRQRTALYKIPAIVKAIFDERADNRDSLVFAYHKPVLAALAAAVQKAGLRPAIVSGDMNSRLRQLTIDRFQGGEFDCVLATYESAYQGYTITRASSVLHLEMHNIADRVKQAEDRANRRGQTKVVRSLFFVIPGSYDDIRTRQMMEKDQNSLILSGDARRLIRTDIAA